MHGLKYSLKLKELNKKNVHTNMKCYHPSSLFPLSLAYAHLPRHGKKCWAKKRRICFVHLRILIYGGTPDMDLCATGHSLGLSICGISCTLGSRPGNFSHA